MILIAFSLSEDKLASLQVTEEDRIVVSPNPFSLDEADNDRQCISNFSERSFNFNLSDCSPKIEVKTDFIICC